MMSVVPYWGWIVFIAGGVVCVAVGIVAALSTLWSRQERRDGKR